MGLWDQIRVHRFHMNLRVATGKGLEDTPTCDPDMAALICIRDNIGIRMARNFQGPASVVWGDRGSCHCVLMSTSPATLRTLAVGGEGSDSPRGLRSYTTSSVCTAPSFCLGGNRAVRPHGPAAALPEHAPQDWAWNFRVGSELRKM